VWGCAPPKGAPPSFPEWYLYLGYNSPKFKNFVWVYDSKWPYKFFLAHILNILPYIALQSENDDEYTLILSFFSFFYTNIMEKLL
jgi:hypothetical protein